MADRSACQTHNLMVLDSRPAISKNFCKEYSVEQKQIKSTTAAYSKLQMFGGKTCHACTQLEHVFSSRVHA